MFATLRSFLTSAHSQPSADDEVSCSDELMVIVSDHQRGKRLYAALERQQPAMPPDDFGVVWRPATGAEWLAAPSGPSPQRGRVLGRRLDNCTLTLRAPSEDAQQRVDLLEALLDQHVGLIVDLNAGQLGGVAHDLATSWEAELPDGCRASLGVIDVAPAEGLPDSALNHQLDLRVTRPPEAGAQQARPRKASIEVVALRTPVTDQALDLEDALSLVRYCQGFRDMYPNERVAFLSGDGLGAAVALAAMERLFIDCGKGRLRPADSEAAVLDHASRLRKSCGPFALFQQDLTTVADFAEYLAANPKRAVRTGPAQA